MSNGPPGLETGKSKIDNVSQSGTDVTDEGARMASVGRMEAVVENARGSAPVLLVRPDGD